MVMPRSRSSSMESSTCSFISRAVSPPQCWISRSASVDLPWSIWAMMAKLRIWARSVITVAAPWDTRGRALEDAVLGEVGGFVGGPVALRLLLHIVAPLLAANLRRAGG